MIAVPAGVRVLVWSSPVDFRKGIDGLCAYVQLTLEADPFAGDVFVFRSRRADRIKLLTYDGTGLCLYQKRLERGRFRWPPVSEGVVRLTARFESQGAGRRFRLGCTRRWSIRRIMARVTMASETSGSSS